MCSHLHADTKIVVCEEGTVSEDSTQQNQYLSEPAMHQLVESFCKPVLLYNLIAVNISKTECARIVNAWNVIMYKIYGVSGDTLKSVYVFTKCLPIRTELLIRQLTLLKSCAEMDNRIVQHVYMTVLV